MREGWEIKKLGEVCDVLNGLWIGKKEPFVNICVIRNTNFTKDCKLNLDNVAYIDVEEKQYLSRKLKVGDIIIEKSGGSDKQPVGRVVLFDIEKGDFSFSNFTSTLRIKSDIHLNSNYLHKCLYAYYLKGETFKLQSKTTGLHNLDMKGYLRLSIPIPPLEEQERIVEKLDCLLGVIEKKKQQLKELDALAQSIFYEMFGNPVENDRGWEVKKFKDACEKIGDGLHGTPIYSEVGLIPFVNGTNLDNGSIRITDKTLYVDVEEAQKYHIEMSNSTILFSINGTLGRVALYKGENIILGKSVCYCNLKSLLMIKFVFTLMQTNAFKQFLEDNSSKSTIKNVGLKAIREFMMIIPPLSLQQEFASKIEAIEKQKELIRKSIEEVEMLFNSRMDYYFG